MKTRSTIAGRTGLPWVVAGAEVERERQELGKLLAATGTSRIGVLCIQALLAPHIAEESDTRMDQLEASMAKEEIRARAGLEGLAALPALRGDADVATAASRFARYVELESRILALSRETTTSARWPCPWAGSERR